MYDYATTCSGELQTQKLRELRTQSVESSALKVLHQKPGVRQYIAMHATLTARRDDVQPLLQALHWLPVQARVDYKLSTVCHNFFTDSSPAYLSDLLTVYTPSRQLRSSEDTLPIPYVKTKTFFGQCFFLLHCSKAKEFSPF